MHENIYSAIRCRDLLSHKTTLYLRSTYMRSAIHKHKRRSTPLPISYTEFGHVDSHTHIYDAHIIIILIYIILVSYMHMHSGF